MTLIVGLDIGTSNIKAIAYDWDATPVSESRVELAMHTDAGYAVQRPSDWWEGAVLALRQLSEKLGTEAAKVQAIGLTGQCPTFTLLYGSGLDMQVGMMYQDNRAVQETNQLIEQFGMDMIHIRTGEAPSPFFILPKLLWLRRNRPDLWQEDACVLQPRDYIGWKLTGKLATDPTHAACTLVYDIQTGQWIKEWLEELGLGALTWPDVLPSEAQLGNISSEIAAITGLSAGLPIIVGGADSLCAVYGAGLQEHGVLFDISGTSTCLHLLVNQPVNDTSVNTYPHVLHNQWCAEAGINTTGAALKWLADTLRMPLSELFEEAATINPGADGLFFLPHLANGERDAPSRPGAFVGISLSHSRGHLARAVLEGVVFALCVRIDALRKSEPITGMIASGGAAASLWNQIKADVFRVPVEALALGDTTVLGAAMLAARNRGLEMKPRQDTSSYYSPDPVKAAVYQEIYQRFIKLEARLLDC